MAQPDFSSDNIVQQEGRALLICLSHSRCLFQTLLRLASTPRRNADQHVLCHQDRRQRDGLTSGERSTPAEIRTSFAEVMCCFVRVTFTCHNGCASPDHNLLIAHDVNFMPDLYIFVFQCCTSFSTSLFRPSNLRTCIRKAR